MVVEFLGKDVEFDEVVDTFDVHGPYCKEVEVHGTDDEGFVYSAIGISDGDEITEIEEGSIECIDTDSHIHSGWETWMKTKSPEYLESLVDNNPDDGSWVGR